MKKKRPELDKKCVCDEVGQKMGWGESRTFSCPIHGQVTIDRRVITNPLAVPVPQPAPSPNPWPPYQPYIGDFPPYNPVICGNTYTARGTEQITYTN